MAIDDYLATQRLYREEEATANKRVGMYDSVKPEERAITPLPDAPLENTLAKDTANKLKEIEGQTKSSPFTKPSGTKVNGELK